MLFNQGGKYESKANFNRHTGYIGNHCNGERPKGFCCYDYDKYMSDIEKKVKHRFVPVIQIGLIKRF